MSPAGSVTDGAPVLGIETATPYGSVALRAGGRLKGEFLLHNPRSHSERLFFSIESLLGQCGFVPSDLGAIAVSMGPGSFTGLRVGLAAAKGLAFSLGAPLFGIPTLEVLAAAAVWTGPLCAVIDARRGELFSAFFEIREGTLREVSPPEILSPEDLAGALVPGTLIVGELTASRRTLLEKKSPRGTVFAPDDLGVPRASQVALQGESLLAGGLPSQAETLTPLYLRPSDAEEMRKCRPGPPG